MIENEKEVSIILTHTSNCGLVAITLYFLYNHKEQDYGNFLTVLSILSLICQIFNAY